MPGRGQTSGARPGLGCKPGRKHRGRRSDPFRLLQGKIGATRRTWWKFAQNLAKLEWGCGVLFCSNVSSHGGRRIGQRVNQRLRRHKVRRDKTQVLDKVRFSDQSFSGPGTDNKKKRTIHQKCQTARVKKGGS